MGERRVSGWFILSAVFIVLVFGLFFTFTERKTWPEHKVELGSMDMILVPPVSTLWCEAVALHSDHYFVAYQVNHSGQINPMRLKSQSMRSSNKKLGRSWINNFEEYKYFLLPSSVMEIVACSSSPGVKLLIFKGDVDVLDCLKKLNKNAQDLQVKKTFSKVMDYDSYEDDSEDEDIEYSSEEYIFQSKVVDYKKVCSSLLHFQSIDLTDDDASSECNPLTKVHPIKMNISSAEYYVVVIWNANPNLTNYVNLRVMLDRTRYVVQRSQHPLGICSLSNSCTIGLSFASGDRVLVTIPEESNAGRSTAVIRFRCKPRLAIFAIISVFLPLLMFLTVAFVVRADREIFGKIFRERRDQNNRLPSNQRTIPLLDGGTTSSFESIPPLEARSGVASVQIEDMPPPYHTLYDPPPPYTCVKDKRRNNDQGS